MYGSNQCQYGCKVASVILTMLFRFGIIAIALPKQCGDVAQLGERLNGIQEVRGSIPLISTKNNPGNIEFPGFCFALEFV